MISITLKLFSLLLCLVAVRSEKPLAQGIICERACRELPGATLSCIMQKDKTTIRFITRAGPSSVKHIPDGKWHVYNIDIATTTEKLCGVVKAGDDFYKAKKKDECHKKRSYDDAGDYPGHPLGLWSGQRMRGSSKELVHQKRILPLIMLFGLAGIITSGGVATAAAIDRFKNKKKDKNPRHDFDSFTAMDPNLLKDPNVKEAMDDMLSMAVVNPGLACNAARGKICETGQTLVCHQNQKCCLQSVKKSGCSKAPIVAYSKCFEDLSTMFAGVK